MENKKEIRLDEKVMIKSIAPWTTGSPRKTTSGDISIPPNGSILVSREEIIAQSQNGNKLINGIDGLGSHATWYIEDEYCRNELSFETGTKKQDCLTLDKIKDAFGLKTMKAFKDRIEKNVITRAEKAYLMSSIKTLNLNEWDKNAFCVEYTGIQIE